MINDQSSILRVPPGQKKLFLGAVWFLLVGCSLPFIVSAPATRLPDSPAGVTLPPAITLPAPLATPTLPPVLPTAVPALVAQTPTALALAGLPLPALTTGQPITLIQIQMMTAQIGWGVGYQIAGQDHIVRTEDGGLTWREASPPAAAQSLFNPAVLFRSLQTAWAAYPSESGQPAAVWRTADGGLSWAEAPLPPEREGEFFVPALFAAEGSRGWLLVQVGAGMQHAYSDLFTSDDEGRSWQKTVTPFSEAASPLMLFPHSGMTFRGSTGWVTKENGVMDGVALVTSSDGGLSWVDAQPAPPVSGDGMLCSTYSPILFGPQSGYYLTDCWNSANDSQQAYFTRLEAGAITYAPLASPVDTLIFFSPQEGLALGCRDLGAPDPLRCDIFSTQDGGQNWTLVKTVNWDGQFSFPDPQNGWAIARSGQEIALVRSSDGGQHWQILHPVISLR